MNKCMAFGVVVVSLALIGCGDSSTPQPKPPTSTDLGSQMQSAAKDAGSKMETAAKDAKAKAEPAAKDAKAKLDAAAADAAKSADAAAKDASSNTDSAAKSVDAAASAQHRGEELLAKATQYLKDKKLSDAEPLLTQLEGMKDSLPETLQNQIAKLRSTYNTLQAAADAKSGKVPTELPSFK